MRLSDEHSEQGSRHGLTAAHGSNKDDGAVLAEAGHLTGSSLSTDEAAVGAVKRSIISRPHQKVRIISRTHLIWMILSNSSMG